jgi:hypothetical protein
MGDLRTGSYRRWNTYFKSTQSSYTKPNEHGRIQPTWQDIPHVFTVEYMELDSSVRSDVMFLYAVEA